MSHSRSSNRLWRLSAILAWADTATEQQRAAAELVAAVNGALELRAHTPALDPAAREQLQRLTAA